MTAFTAPTHRSFPRALKEWYDFIEEGLTSITAGTAAALKPLVTDANKAVDALRTAALYIGASGSETLVGATAAELNAVADVSTRLIAGGATLSLTAALHAGRTVLFDTAAGTVLTLPNATGTGDRYRAVVSVTATSNSHVIKAGTANDIFYGSILNSDTDTSDATIAWAAEVGDTFDTVTLNRSTTGQAEIGDWLEFEDIGTNKWAMRGAIRSNGSVATPLTSAV